MLGVRGTGTLIRHAGEVNVHVMFQNSDIRCAGIPALLEMGMETVSGNIRLETAPDGTRIRVGHWPAPPGPSAGRVLLLQGRTEFLEKYDETIADLHRRSFEVWAFDWRGQGLSDRLLANRHKGHIDRFETYLQDLQWFCERVVPPAAPGVPTIVLAHSMGGHIALRALMEGRLRADRAVLSAPMIDLPLSGAARLGIRTLAANAAALGFCGRYAPGMGDYDPDRVKFDGNPLTGDARRFERFHSAITANPDLALGGVTFGWLAAAFRSIAALRSLARTASPGCRVLICTALEDTVVSIAAQAAIGREIEDFTSIGIPGARHETLIETDAVRNIFWEHFDAFVEPPYETP